MNPTIDRIVIYRSKRNPYDLPAIVTATVDSLWPDGVASGQVPPLSSPTHVHLHVLSPGAESSYREHDVPFDEARDAHVPPGTWRWPART